jgi:hypothetical protein
MELANKYGLTREDYTIIQYYLSQSMTFRREVTTMDSKRIAEGHKLKSEKGKLIEEIEFANGLPGITIRTEGPNIFVSFEKGKVLQFSCIRPGGSKFDDSGTYYLVLKGDKVEYDNLIYSLSASAPIFLEVREDNLSNVEKTKREATGLRLPNY